MKQVNETKESAGQKSSQPNQSGKLVGVVNCNVVNSIMERESLGKYKNFSSVVGVPRVFEKHSKLIALAPVSVKK